MISPVLSSWTFYGHSWEPNKAPPLVRRGLRAGPGRGVRVLITAGLIWGNLGMGVWAQDLRAPFDGFFDVDWSLGLAGVYQSTQQGGQYETRVTPRVTLAHEGRRANVRIEAEARLGRLDQDSVTLAGLRLALAGDYRLDPVTGLSVRGELALSQDSLLDIARPREVIAPADISSLRVDAELVRQAGRFTVTGRAGAGRQVNGPSTLAGHVEVDNSQDNVTGIDAGLRVAYGLTPVIGIFADAGLGHEAFDGEARAYGARLDGTTQTLRAGVSGDWGVWRAEASVGLGLRRFEAGGIDEIGSTLYDARVSYTPNQTLNVTGALSTAIAPPGPDAPDAMRVETVAELEAGYRINRWLALRAGALWSTADFVGTGTSEIRHGYGVGADYALGAHSTISADYRFSRREVTGEPAEEAHRVMFGLTLSR